MKTLKTENLVEESEFLNQIISFKLTVFLKSKIVLENVQRKVLGWANESEVYLNADYQRLACLLSKMKTKRHKNIFYNFFWGGQKNREGLKLFKQKENFDKTKTKTQSTHPPPPLPPLPNNPNKPFLKGVIITGGRQQLMELYGFYTSASLLQCT